jgi:hypothetical protein
MLGDLTNFGDTPSLDRGLAHLAACPIPVLTVPGNHDCGDAVDRLAIVGAAATPRPVRAATTDGEPVAELRVVGLPIARPDAENGWLVDVPEVAAWGDEPAIVLSHFPVFSREAAARQAGLRYAGTSADRDGFAAALLARPGPTVVIHGHLHIRDAVALGPVLQIGCAALIEPPHEVATVALEREDGAISVAVRRQPVAPSPPVRLPLLTGDEGAWTYRDRAWWPTT